MIYNIAQTVLAWFALGQFISLSAVGETLY